MKKLLVVVDYQVDFVSGTLGFPDAQKLDPRIVQKIKETRENGGEIAFTYDTHAEQYLDTKEGQLLPVRHCLEGSPGWELYGATAQAKQPKDHCFYKPAFGSLELANWLQQTHYTQVELVGLVSNICVLSNAVLVKAALPEAEVIVDSACTASFDPDLHKKTLDILKGLFVTVL